MIRGDETSREICIRGILSDPKYRNGIQKIVTDRSGTDDDVTFVMNHTLVAFMKGVLKNRSLTIETNLYSYLNGIGKYIWLAELRQKATKRNKEVSIEIAFDVQIAGGFELGMLNQEKSSILHMILEKMGDKCKQVLLLWSAGYSMREVADKVGYKSEGVARKKKFQCMQSLAEYLESNPHCKEMLR